MYIDGQWVSAQSGKVFDVFNPAEIIGADALTLILIQNHLAPPIIPNHVDHSGSGTQPGQGDQGGRHGATPLNYDLPGFLDFFLGGEMVNQA